MITVQGPWLLGFIAIHTWSFAGDSDRPATSMLLFQPVIAYAFAKTWAVTHESDHHGGLEAGAQRPLDDSGRPAAREGVRSRGDEARGVDGVVLEHRAPR